MWNAIKKFLGFPTTPTSSEVVDTNRQEIHDMKNQAAKEILQSRQRLDQINKQTNQELDSISKQLGTIAESVAYATGRKVKSKT